MDVEDDGKGHIRILCEYCGKPISKTSNDFGMDCEDDCSRKEYDKPGNPSKAEFDKWFPWLS
jgi:hypothetical protein